MEVRPLRACGVYVVLSLLVGCAHSKRLQFDTAAATRIQTIPEPEGALKLSHLDVNGNGNVDANDARWFAAIASAALAAGPGLKEVPNWLYEGSPKDEQPVWGFVKATNGTIDVSNVPAERRDELVIEARYLQRLVDVLAPTDRNEPVVADNRLAGGFLNQHLPAFSNDSLQPSQVCAVIDEAAAFDGWPKKNGEDTLPKSAILDLDSTVWAGNIMDVFLAQLSSSGVVKPSAGGELHKFMSGHPAFENAGLKPENVHDNLKLLYTHYTGEGNASMPVSAKDMFYTIVSLLKDSTPDEIYAVAQKAWDEGASPYGPWSHKVFHDPACSMPDAIAKMQQGGIKVYLLSATLDVLAQVGGENLGVPKEQILGSVLEVKGGVYTGKVAGSTYYTKGAIARQWLPAPPLLAFGDSPSSDFSMLTLAVGPAFMINARPKFIERDEQEAAGRFTVVTFESTKGDK